jgi:retron-type reverse transcriptase
MKVYERVIRVELLPKVIDKIDKRQHGFLPSKSCETQLIPYNDMLAQNLNKGSRTDVIYFEFAKAFDSVNHDIILYKLKHKFGIDGLLLKFFVEYLCKRYQRDVINGSSSSDLLVNSGVPQGSILGPVLFVLFINDISDDVDAKSSICLYADDTKLYRRIETSDDQAMLQNDINHLYDWANLNKMRFHPDKCKLLSVTLNRDNYPGSPYKLGDVNISHVDIEKDLGVYITSRLNWTDHSNYRIMFILKLIEILAS